MTPRDSRERMLTELPPFVCLEHGDELELDGDASLACPTCGPRLRFDPDYRDLLDGTEDDGAPNEKVKFAYRIYSMVYPVVALFAMWFVWMGSIRAQVWFYRDAIQAAAERGSPFLDVATGDGSLTNLALRAAGGTPAFLAVDLSRDMLVKASKRLRRYPKLLYRCDIADAALAPGGFSDILCFGGIHVFADPKGALEQMRRHLADDGTLSGSYLLRPGTPRRDRIADWAIEKGLLSTSYTEAEFDQLVADAGYRYEKRELNGRMLLFTLTRD